MRDAIKERYCIECVGECEYIYCNIFFRSPLLFTYTGCHRTCEYKNNNVIFIRTCFYKNMSLSKVKNVLKASFKCLSGYVFLELESRVLKVSFKCL